MHPQPLSGVTPVSYTHLDVYKRQTGYSGATCPNKVGGRKESMLSSCSVCALQNMVTNNPINNDKTFILNYYLFVSLFTSRTQRT